MENINEQTKEFADTSNWGVNASKDYVTYSFDTSEGTSTSVVYNIFPGISLIFFDIHAKSLPAEPNSYINSNISQFNYCVDGRIEFLLDDNTYFYLTKNNFALSCQDAGSASYFPTTSYQGINIFFDMNVLSSADDTIFNTFGLDFSRLSEIYFNSGKTYAAESNSELKTLMEKLWGLFEAPSVFHARLYMLEFLHLMLSDKISAAKRSTFYSKVQVDIAKKAEQLLTADLSKHISIKTLAEQFCVSETSLKNYFKNVYGMNISEYTRDLRINTAARLLSETTLSVAEISHQIGYAKQGKFAAAFKARTGMNPLEYRRNARCQAL